MLKNNRSGHYYTNQLWFSDAYQELSMSARDLLHILISELRWSWMRKGRKKEKRWSNNGNVSCTGAEFKEITGAFKKTSKGACASTYQSARNQLIKVGFIKITHRGGEHRGDRSRYRVLIDKTAMGGFNERWTQYPKENWEHEVPKTKKQLIGKKTQWKKGQCGRKL
jgi:hypothetical protein